MDEGGHDNTGTMEVQNVNPKQSLRSRHRRKDRGRIFDEPFNGQRLASHVTKLGSRIAGAHQRSCGRTAVSNTQRLERATRTSKDDA